ncbi:MAG TPA: hypothetical protein VH702_07510 [Vicinamibacterales bacterium]|jgi:hypothetical protein
MLDDVGEVDAIAGNTGVFEGARKKTAGRPNEWLSFEILLVTRLLADQ